MSICKMANVDAAEKEASEVLHSLLSVERIVKHESNRNNHLITIGQQINNEQIKCEVVGGNNVNNTNDNDNRNATDSITVAVTTNSNNLQWQGNVAITSHSIFEEHFSDTIDEQQVHDVVWRGHTIQVPTSDIDNLYSSSHSSVDENVKNEEIIDDSFKSIPPTNNIKKISNKKLKKNTALSNSNGNNSNLVKKEKIKKKRKEQIERSEWESTALEENASQVKERFKRGCECQDESCFRGLSPESVYKHRLNIAELTKSEHDMYLMGVTMACLANPDITVRHKERQRLRAQYVYQGRRVCLDAFLYLENCTHYQLKRIRKHVMTHGVAPRVHGNHGKKPHNTFSLDIYQHATDFLKQYLETHTGGDWNVSNVKSVIQLPWDVTRKTLHNSYKEYSQMLDPTIKLMGYSTFRHFLKEQFPHVRFCKVEPKNQLSAGGSTQQINTIKSQIIDNQRALNSNNQYNKVSIENNTTTANTTTTTTTATIITTQSDQFSQNKTVIGQVQQVIPLVVSSHNTNDHQTSQSNQQQHHNHHQTATFLVGPVSQLIPNNTTNLMQSTSHTSSSTTSTFPYQITNTGYVITNEDGNIVANQQPQATTYTFSRM